jgi:hypothetical protein
MKDSPMAPKDSFQGSPIERSTPSVVWAVAGKKKSDVIFPCSVMNDAFSTTISEQKPCKAETLEAAPHLRPQPYEKADAGNLSHGDHDAVAQIC